MKGTKEDPIQLHEVVIRPQGLTVSFNDLKQIVPTLPKNADVFVPYINEIVETHSINTVRRLAAFISQFAHETQGFAKLRETASGAAYDTGKKAVELGNTPAADGDGQFYRGRGGFHVTGRDKYRSCSIALFGDERLLKHPDLLETPEYAVKSAAWYFVMIKGNSLMDLPASWRSNTKGYSPYQYLTYRINAALLHYDRRLEYFNKALKVFG